MSDPSALPPLPVASSSWHEHFAAAVAMGLDAETAYETYEGGFLALARVCRERQAWMRAALDDAERGE